MEAGFFVLAILAAFVMLVLVSAIKIVKEYERGVVFRLGRLVGPRGPGLILLIPFVERMVKVDLRTVTMDVPSQEVITRDNVTVRVNAVTYFRVLDPSAAVTNVTDFMRATSQIAQTTLRSVLGQSSLDELLSEREQINQELQRIIDDQTEPWGVKVSIVEVKDVELPSTMQRAMARQAEAERDKRAKIIHAEGEFQASTQLARAADVIAQHPVALQLRYLQTLSEIGTEQNTTVVFPLPMEMVTLLGAAAEVSNLGARPTKPSGGTGDSSEQATTP
jgi:regulator of protease activity HflC (stomatin/prohibitin superfamily)